MNKLYLHGDWHTLKGNRLILVKYNMIRFLYEQNGSLCRIEMKSITKAVREISGQNSSILYTQIKCYSEIHQDKDVKLLIL